MYSCATVAPLVGAWIEIQLSTLRSSGRWSLLSWERGLKYRFVCPQLIVFVSLLSWERGLKCCISLRPSSALLVAPLVGAWIEIRWELIPEKACLVAPLVGAWIEIAEPGRWKTAKAVAPLVGAWIEIPLCLPTTYCFCVAPLVGAWIEILCAAVPLPCTPSLLSWERGLKYQV